MRTTELMGNWVYVKADIAGVAVTAIAPADFRAAPRSTVGFRVTSPRAIRLFDAANGLAIRVS